MTFALARESDPVDAFKYGIAAGTAAVLTPGTDLCHRADVERIYALITNGTGQSPAALPAVRNDMEM